MKLRKLAFQELTRNAAFAFAVVVVAGCSAASTQQQPIIGGFTPPTAPTTTPTTVPTTMPTPTPTTAASSCTTTPFVQSAVTASSGATLNLAPSTGGNYAFTIPANALSANTTATFGEIKANALPAPLANTREAFGAHSPYYRRPQFTAGAGNTYVYAFCSDFGGATLSNSVGISGTGVVPASVGGAGTVLNIALNQNNTWVDVGTATVGANSALTSNAPSSGLPGVRAAGKYLLYKPASGTNTTAANFGIAVIGDDDSANSPPGYGLQYFKLEDGNSNALATPQQAFVPIQNGKDLEGQALTPDGSVGLAVGASNVYIYTGLPTGTLVVSSASLSISAFGREGAGIGALPNGDEAVVAVVGSSLPVISGILSGNPKIVDSIPLSPTATAASQYPYGGLDGLVMSQDGKTMIGRGSYGITIWRIDTVPAFAGPLGGTETHRYTQTAELLASAATNPVANSQSGQGREGMSISPTDSSRAVIVGATKTTVPTIQLLTGLPNSPTVQSLPLRLPQSQAHSTQAFAKNESGGRRPEAITATGVAYLYAVSITPDGKFAIVGTDSGIVVVSGIDTGNLAQVGAPYNPTITIPAGGGTTSTCLLGTVRTLGITLDGKYVAAVPSFCRPTVAPGTAGDTVLVTIPLSNGSLGPIAGQFNGAVSSFSDQMVMH